MEKILKVINLKVVLLCVVVAFFLQNTLYGIEPSCRVDLRNQLLFSDSNRADRIQNGLSAAIERSGRFSGRILLATLLALSQGLGFSQVPTTNQEVFTPSAITDSTNRTNPDKINLPYLDIDPAVSAKIRERFEQLLQQIADKYYDKYFKHIGLYYDGREVINDLAHGHILKVGDSLYILYHSQEFFESQGLDIVNRNILQNIRTGEAVDPIYMAYSVRRNEGEPLPEKGAGVTPHEIITSLRTGNYDPDDRSYADVDFYREETIDTQPIRDKMNSWPGLTRKFLPGPPIIIKINGNEYRLRLCFTETGADADNIIRTTLRLFINAITPQKTSYILAPNRHIGDNI